MHNFKNVNKKSMNGLKIFNKKILMYIIIIFTKLNHFSKKH